jgi:hypothetical protein
MSRWLDMAIGQIDDADVGRLVAEMYDAAGVNAGLFSTQRFLPFLIALQKPWHAGYKRTPFHSKYTRPGFLETAIVKIQSESIQGLCSELAHVIAEPLEMHVNRKLMSFLNYCVLTLEKRQRARDRARSKRRGGS